LMQRVWWIRASSPTPDHGSDCLHNRSATPSRCSSSETTSQMFFRYLASAPRQCAMPHGPECQGILGQAQHPRGSPPALLTRFGPLWLLPIPQAEEHPEGETITRRRGDTTKYDTAVAGHSQTSLSGGSYFEGENLHMLSFSYNKFCPGYFWSDLIYIYIYIYIYIPCCSQCCSLTYSKMSSWDNYGISCNKIMKMHEL
jgi:hypothetical protein